jgi:pSer/pThr/pTyr-binding forkhead associated (FHA) protein
MTLSSPFKAMLAMRAQLIPLDGAAPISISKDLTLVGRRDQCDVRLVHQTISKMHCMIVKTDGLLFLRDLGSTNGTRVNGQRVRRAALLPNDQLAIAGHKFRVALGPDEPAQPQDGTLQLDPAEIANLQRKTDPRRDGSEAVHAPESALQANPLPDRYPDSQTDRA